jgi:hypothetical protein
MPVAVTVVLELTSAFLPHYIYKGEWPKGASEEQKASGVKPNHQQMHTAGDVHISNVILATHLRTEITHKGHLQTFDLWTRRMDKVNLTSLILRYTKLEHPHEFNMMFGLPPDTKRLWSEEDLPKEMDADPKQLAHWNIIMSQTFAIKEPGFAARNPNNTINRDADYVVREVHNGRYENAIIMIGEFDIETAKEELSDVDLNALEAYLNDNLVGRGMWDSTTLSSHEEGRKGRFQNGWTEKELEEYFDEHFGFELKRFKTEESVPTGI